MAKPTFTATTRKIIKAVQDDTPDADLQFVICALEDEDEIDSGVLRGFIREDLGAAHEEIRLSI